MNEAAKRYKNDHPDFKIKVIDADREATMQKLQTMLASGVTSALPDIVLIEDYDATKYLQAFPGSFAPLQEEIDHSRFAPYKVEVMTNGDNIYGVPFDSGVAGMFYRSDILSEAGFKDSDMQNITWDRFIEIGQQVKAKTGIDMLTFDMTNVVLPHIMMQSGGQWFFDKEGKLNLVNNEPLKAMLETTKKIVDAKIVRQTNGWSNYVGSFNSGKVATVISGVWIMGSIKSVPEQKGKWRVAPIPSLSIAGAVHTSNQGGSSWYVLSKGKNTKGAIEFLKATFAEDTDMYQKLLVDIGAFATYLPAGNGSAYKTKDPFFSGQPVFADFSKWAAKIPQVSYGIYTQEVDNAIMSEIPALLGGEPVDEILKRADQTLRHQIAQ
jgi:lactose/L-arabinose transport system substrate-binding protein